MKTPFTSTEFFEVFADYNTSLFPAQLLIVLLGLIAVGLIHTRLPLKDRLIAGFLGLIWIWAGGAYHIKFFSAINKPAYAFGVLFFLQGLFLIYEGFIRKRFSIEFSGKPMAYTGYFFIIFGLIIYPLIGYALEQDFARVISMGLPCPTVILTFGFLMLTKSNVPKYLLILPTLWAVIGLFAAINFGVHQDYMMIAAAITADIFLFARKKNQTID